jgi:hypothetical protein
MTKRWKEKLISGDLISVRCFLSMIHKDARDHIQEQDAPELRDLCEDLINKIDSFGEKHVENWEPQDMGVV